MIQLELSNEEIQTLASHQMSYQQGLFYFRSGRVKNLCFNPDERRVSAEVIGNRSYQVEIDLTRLGSVRDYKCTCPAFSHYFGACKHIVAVLKAIKENSSSISKKVKTNNAANDLLAFFESNTLEPFRDELNLELHLLLHINSSFNTTASLSLKLGLQRLYIIKDIGEFLRCLKTGESLEFGKQFTFEPFRQAFKSDDQPIIDMLTEMFDQHLAWQEIENSFLSQQTFPKKILPLTGFYLKKFLDVIGKKNLFLSIGTKQPKLTHINRDGIPLEFSLNDSERDLELIMDLEHFPIQLTPDGRYFFYHREIFQSNPTQQEYLPPILKAFHIGQSNTLVLPSNKREFFVSEALPALQKIGQVNIDTELQTKLIRESLITKIFFEKGKGENTENGISARVEFHYGETLINPFGAAGDSRHNQTDSLEVLDEHILIRSFQEERTILGILERAEFSVTQGKIHLEDDEKIFDFARLYLPKLQELAELYYSEDFKLTIRSTVSFSGRLRLDENLDLLEISFQYNDLKEEELSEIFYALNLKKKFFRLKDGSFLNLNQAELETIALLLKNLDLQAKDFVNQEFFLPKYRALYIENYLRQANLPGIQRNKAFKHLVQNILEPHDAEFEIPNTLQNVLRDYQKTGFKWLKTLSSYGLGGILADDMGLGKTLQVLAFILSEAQSSTRPALVIAPTSLIYNWQQEAQKFAPELKVLVVEGAPNLRQSLLADFENWDLIVTSYPLLRRDTEIYASLEFSFCFLDEAQHIKNPQTINAKSVQQINAKGYFALTGTPIENSLSELWSIFNFIMPGYLSSYSDFRKKFEIPVLKGEDPAPLTELSHHVTPFILRRMKKDVLFELPDKIESKLTTQMTEEQKKIYLAFLQEAKKNIKQEIQTVGFERSHIKILAALTRLRQICSHPAMFLENYTGKSGKMLLFEEILADALDSGHRILVFSQFTTMLDLIKDYLQNEKIDYFYLSGTTKAHERLHMVQSFNEGVGNVFLISLKAGGTGLNLTGADMVIHFDPWWNPAVEDQATDRAHRIGQKKAVQVIKLITQGTIEEKVYALQEKKKELIQSVIQPGETFLSKLTEEELNKLFEFN
jgi:SNF2 family DNA or RNA helicase